MSNMTVPQALRATADHLTTYGWARGAFYKPVPQVRLVKDETFTSGPIERQVITEQYLDYDTAPSCTLGALAVATGAREQLMAHGEAGMTYNYSTALSDVTPTPATLLYERAGQQLRKYLELQALGKGEEIFGIPFWNDSMAKSAENVIAMIRAAADFLEARGEAGLHLALHEAREAQRAAARTEREHLRAERSQMQVGWDETLQWTPASAESMAKLSEMLKATQAQVAQLAKATKVPADLLSQLAEKLDVDAPAGDTDEVDAVMAIEDAQAILAGLSEPVPA